MEMNKLPRRILTALSLLALPTLAHAAVIEYDLSEVYTTPGGGLPWVFGTGMDSSIISGDGTGTASSGFTVFGPDGSGATLLTWEFGAMPLYLGAGTRTVSPGAATPGFEDYRPLDPDSVNLTIYYDGQEWASGHMAWFLTRVDNDHVLTATATGIATLTANTVAGQAFYDEVGTLSGGTYEINFNAESFNPIAGGYYHSAGYAEVVPEPSTYAAIAGVLALGITMARRCRVVAR